MGQKNYTEPEQHKDFPQTEQMSTPLTTEKGKISKKVNELIKIIIQASVQEGVLQVLGW